MGEYAVSVLVSRKLPSHSGAYISGTKVCSKISVKNRGKPTDTLLILDLEAPAMHLLHLHAFRRLSFVLVDCLFLLLVWFQIEFVCWK